jgi:tetratricopeptide (TPR) repeat protein
MRTSASLTLSLGFAALVACGACRDDAASVASGAASVQAAPVAGGKRTTSPEIAVKNLDGRIAQGEKMVAKSADPGARAALVSSLLDRSTYLGKVSDLDRVLELESDLAKLPQVDPSILLARASARSAVHDFAPALELIAEAESKHADKTEVRSKRASIQLALGNYEDACATFHELSALPKNHGYLLMEGVCVAQLGRLEEADRLFADAEAAYNDVSPFVLASIYFERGNLWERAGDEKKAVAYYRASLQRLPGHAHAATHLAQLVPAEAEALLAPVLAVSDDPEVKAVLGMLREKASPGTGQALLAEAKQSYDGLLAKHPRAFADHAGWFYLRAVSEPSRAADVAQENLKNRKTHEAYELAIAALSAAGRTSEACESADLALQRKWVPSALQEVADAAFAACGRTK